MKSRVIGRHAYCGGLVDFVSSRTFGRRVCQKCGQDGTRGQASPTLTSELPRTVPGCAVCEEPGTFKPSHNGSEGCESGSLASGGHNSHCTCDRCF